MTTKFATKEMAVEAKAILEKQLDGLSWIKTIEVCEDDHGAYITTKIKNRADYTTSGIKVPSVISINGFNMKNCIVVLG